MGAAVRAAKPPRTRMLWDPKTRCDGVPIQARDIPITPASWYSGGGEPLGLARKYFSACHNLLTVKSGSFLVWFVLVF